MDNERIVDHILDTEGWPTFTRDPHDRGGATKGGVTLGALSDWRGRQATVDDLLALSEPEARAIYLQNYIVRPGFAAIADDLLRWQLVDSGVLHFPLRAIRWLQEALPPLHVDGKLGPRTAAAVNAHEPHALALRFAARRQIFLGEIITANHKARSAGTTAQDQARFAHGWARRAARFVQLEAAAGCRPATGR